MVHRGAGGIRGLCDLLDKYGDEIEADFTQFYRLDIADVWRGALSPRRALVLASRLADVPDSRYRAEALGGREYLGWDRIATLLADLNDAITDNSVVTVKAAGGKATRPDPYPRPMAEAEAEETIDVPTIDDFPIHLVTAMTAMHRQK